MNLKESYRYANFLDGLLTTAYGYLNNKGFVTTTSQEHLRSKANPDAMDENLKVQKPYDVNFTANNVIDFVVGVLAEKERLVNAIAIAKLDTEINIDNSITMNKKKQYFADVLIRMSNIKPSEKTTQAAGRMFNNEKNQVIYYYDVVEKTSIDFDRNDVRNLVKKYLKETDEVSAKLDAIEINTIVDFKPKYDINEEFEFLINTK